jgi:hypothetical protein
MVSRTMNWKIAFTACALLPSLVRSQTSASFTPFGGYVWLDPILDHDYHFSGFYTDWRTHEVLRLSNAPMFGGRLELSRGSRWFGYLQGGYASSRLRYVYSTSLASQQPPGPPQTTESHRWDTAKISTFEIGIGRRLAEKRVRLDAMIGPALYQLRPKRRGGFCPVQVQCDDDRWESVYNVPSATAAVAIRTRTVWRLAVDLEAKGSIGRINTEGFSANPPLNSFLYEAPAHRWLHTVRTSLGFSLGV